MDNVTAARQSLRRIIWLLAAFSLVVNVLMLTMPLYMLQIYDRVLTSSSLDTLTFLSVIAAGALVVLGALEAVRAIIASRAGMRLEALLGADALSLGMEKSKLGNSDTEALRNLSTVRAYIASRGVFALLDMPFTPLFVGILYFIHPTLFYMTLAGVAVLIALAILNQWVTGPANQKANQHLGAAAATSQSVTRNGETLQAMGMRDNGVRLWGNHNAEALTALSSMDSRNAVLTGISRTLRMGLQIALLGVGALLVLKGEMTAGMIFASSIIAGRGLQPIDQAIGGWRQTVGAWQAWKSVSKSLAERRAPTAYTKLPDPKGNLSADGLLVMGPGGPGSPPILNRVSFDIQAGDMVGIVGPSGSGKSTLARVLVGAQTAQAGTVRVDGTKLQDWDPAQIGNAIGYVGQHVELLPGTIAQNIARLAEQPDDRAVLEAAQRAQVHDLINTLPNGYNTMVGPLGTGLSGGQRQRLGLARAFYGNPQIMILDEPNANLDEDGEAALHRALLSAKADGVTIVVVTQRKEVLAIVDKVLRMHQGSKDFYGTREAFVEALANLRKSRDTGKSKPPTQPTAPVHPPARQRPMREVTPVPLPEPQQAPRRGRRSRTRKPNPATLSMGGTIKGKDRK